MSKFFDVITNIDASDFWVPTDKASMRRVAEKNGICEQCQRPLIRAKKFGKKSVTVCMLCRKIYDKRIGTPKTV